MLFFYTSVVWYFIYSFIIVLFVVFLRAIILIFYFKFKFKKKISKEIYDLYMKKIRFLENPKFSNREKIIEIDKYFHIILKEAWYVWDFWAILKKEPKVVNDLNKIWELHKLRNTLVHDTKDFEDKFLRNKRKDYEKELEKLLNNLK